MKLKLADNDGFVIVDEEAFEALNRYTWRKDKGGYICRASRSRHIYMHRELLELKYGDPRECDHINRVRHDNRLKNLRIATSLINGSNRKTPITNTSGFQGVTWKPSIGKWQAQIKFKNKSYYLGVYLNKYTASRIYGKAKALVKEIVESTA